MEFTKIKAVSLCASDSSSRNTAMFELRSDVKLELRSTLAHSMSRIILLVNPIPVCLKLEMNKEI